MNDWCKLKYLVFFVLELCLGIVEYGLLRVICNFLGIGWFGKVGNIRFEMVCISLLYSML